MGESRLQVLNHTRRASPSSVPTASLHFRQGDSCARVEKEAALHVSWSKRGTRCWTWDVYVKLLMQMQRAYGIDTVFLATESREALKTIRDMRSFNWIIVTGDREELDSKGGTWIEHRDRQSSDTVMLSLADLLHLSRGDVFIGNFGSFYSWIAFYTI